MFKRLVACIFGLSLLVCYQAANATIELYNSAYNADGVFSDPFLGYGTSTPVTGSLDATTGLGTLTYTVTGAGTHNFIGFFDYEIDQYVNGFTNEYGTANGTLGAGQSWEIDEPGFAWGDALYNVDSGVLDNTNDVPVTNPDDVSFALGWNFSLQAGETATITMTLADALPTTLPSYYLAQYDTDSLNKGVYYWSDLSISGQQPTGSVPEPGSLALFGVGLIMLGFTTRKSYRKS